MAGLMERLARLIARLRGWPVDDAPWDYADGWLDDDTSSEEAADVAQDPDGIRADVRDDGTL